MNMAQRARMVRQAGMGDIWDVTKSGATPTIFQGGSNPAATGSTGHSTRDAVFGYIDKGLALVNNIFASRIPQQTATVDANTAARLAAVADKAEADEGDGDGFKVAFEDGGLRLGKTKISYTTMGIAAVAWYLIQSPSFSRGRR
jgi:hypothetical protein